MSETVGELMVRRICAAVRSQSAAIREVRTGPPTWDLAFEGMRSNERVKELYGVPLCARLDEPNFLLLGHPVIRDSSLPDDEIRIVT